MKERKSPSLIANFRPILEDINDEETNLILITSMTYNRSASKKYNLLRLINNLIDL